MKNVPPFERFVIKGRFSWSSPTSYEVKDTVIPFTKTSMTRLFSFFISLDWYLIKKSQEFTVLFYHHIWQLLKAFYKLLMLICWNTIYKLPLAKLSYSNITAIKNSLILRPSKCIFVFIMKILLFVEKKKGFFIIYEWPCQLCIVNSWPKNIRTFYICGMLKVLTP